MADNTQMIVDYGLTGNETKEELIEKIKTLHQSEWNWTKLLAEERTKNIELEKQNEKDLNFAQGETRTLAKECRELKKQIDNLNNRNDIYRKHLKELGVDVEAYDTKYDHLL